MFAQGEAVFLVSRPVSREALTDTRVGRRNTALWHSPKYLSTLARPTRTLQQPQVIFQRAMCARISRLAPRLSMDD